MLNWTPSIAVAVFAFFTPQVFVEAPTALSRFSSILVTRKVAEYASII